MGFGVHVSDVVFGYRGASCGPLRGSVKMPKFLGPLPPSADPMGPDLTFFMNVMIAGSCETITLEMYKYVGSGTIILAVLFAFMSIDGRLSTLHSEIFF